MKSMKRVLTLGLFLAVALCQASLLAYEAEMGAPQMPKIMPPPTPIPTATWVFGTITTYPGQHWHHRHKGTPTPTPTSTGTPTPGNSIQFH